MVGVVEEGGDVGKIAACALSAGPCLVQVGGGLMLVVDVPNLESDERLSWT